MFIYNGLVFQRLFPIWFGGFPESSTVTIENSCDLEDVCLLNPWRIITVSKQLKQSQKPADTYADLYLKHVGGIPKRPSHTEPQEVFAWMSIGNVFKKKARRGGESAKSILRGPH